MIFHDLSAGSTAEPADWADNTGTIPPELPPIHSLIVSDGSDSTSIICQTWDRSVKDTHRVGRPTDCETLNAIKIRGRIAMAFTVIGAPSIRVYAVLLDNQGGNQLAETFVDIAVPSFSPVAFEFPMITGLDVQGNAITSLCIQYSGFCAGANPFDATVMISEITYDYLQDLPVLESYSEVVGRATTLAENQYRAENNKIVMHRIDDDAVAIRAQYPETRLYTYNLHRLISPGDAALWNTFAGAGAEAGYIHHAGVRRQLPSGGLTGYYVMNMGHAPYVAWQASRAVKMLQGLMYGGPPGQHDGMIMDAVQVDLTMWYAAYDVGHENILTSTEYSGNGAAYSSACVSAFASVQAAVRIAFPFVPGVVTPPPQVYPNFGDLSFLANVDADTMALVATSRVIEAQQALTYSNGEPNLNATTCEARWATIAATAGKDLLAHGLLTTPVASATPGLLIPFEEQFDDVSSVGELLTDERWGNTQEESGGTVEISTEKFVTGTKSLKCIAPADAKADIVRFWLALQQGMEITFSFRVWIDSWSPAGGDTLSLFDIEDPDQDGAPCGAPGVFTSPGRQLYISSGFGLKSILNKWCYTDTFNQIDGVPFPTGQWVDLRVWLYLSANADGRMRVWRNGTLALDGTGRTLPDGSSTYSRLQLGITKNNSLTSAAVAYIDDIHIYSDRNRAKIGAAAWFLMAARAGLHARFATAVDAPEDVSTWEQPNLINTAAGAFGAPAGAYELVAGAWVKGNLYRRTFEHGRAYLFVRKTGQVGAETAVLSVPVSAAYSADGSLGAPTTMLSLTLGEGAVLQDSSFSPGGRKITLEGPPIILTADAPDPVISNAPIEISGDVADPMIGNPPIEIERGD
jgi:hypothetical protein